MVDKKTLADPVYAAIERAVFDLGGWLVTANRLALTPEAMKRMARSVTGRKSLLDILQELEERARGPAPVGEYRADDSRPGMYGGEDQNTIGHRAVPRVESPLPPARRYYDALCTIHALATHGGTTLESMSGALDDVARHAAIALEPTPV